MLDHLVYAVLDLDAAVDDLAARTGVRPTPGGRHPGRGTRNALLALGRGGYLEIIGPDPSEPPPPGPRAFGIDRLAAARLVTWAVKAPDIEARVARARAAGYDPGEVVQRSRERPDGTRLDWRLTVPGDLRGDGLVPFLIDWGATPHPSLSAAPGCVLADLRGEHPQPDAVSLLLAALGVELVLSEGPAPALIATIATPRGRLEIR